MKSLEGRSLLHYNSRDVWNLLECVLYKADLVPCSDIKPSLHLLCYGFFL